MRAPLIVFDLDGTLVDSVRDIAQASHHALQYLGLREQSSTLDENFVALVNDSLGFGLAHSVKTLIEYFSSQKGMSLNDPQIEPQIEKAIHIAQAYYLEHPCEYTIIFDGVIDTLEALQQQVPLAILSNKDEDLVKIVVEQLFATINWYKVHGAVEGRNKKPHKEAFIQVSEGQPAIMVGDMDADVETAINAKVPFIGAGWGYYEAKLRAPNHTVLQSPHEILSYLKRE